MHVMMGLVVTRRMVVMAVRVLVAMLVTVLVDMAMGMDMHMLVAMRVGVDGLGVFAADAELGGANTSTRHAFRPHRVGGNRQAAERAANICERHAGVDEGAQHHVAGRAREAIEVQDPQIHTILPCAAARGNPSGVVSDPRTAVDRLP